MKSIATLIKLHKKNLDQIIMEKSKMEEELQHVTKQRDDLVEESKHEIKKYHGSEYADILSHYLKEFRSKCENLDSVISNYQQQISELELKLQNEFSELKKFELVQRQRLDQKLKKEQKQETADLDEMNIGKYIRNKDK